jgi:hypothetical protein
MKISFTKEETELLIRMFDKRISYLQTINGKRLIRGYSNIRDLLSIEGSWDYSKPQRVKILSCLNEAILQNKDEEHAEAIKAIKNRILNQPA